MRKQNETRRIIRHHRLRFASSLLALGTAALSVSCSFGNIVDVQRPADIVDPKTLKAYAGAIQVYNGAVSQFAGSFSGVRGGNPFTVLDALFADELQPIAAFRSSADPVDARLLPEDRFSLTSFDNMYGQLQTIRIRVEQGIGAIRKYAPAAPKSFTGQLFALGGYGEIMLAESFCSGVPLSSAPFEGDIVYGASLTTVQLLGHAISQFDSTLVYATDSARVLNLARIGRGRALLDLGKFADAATAVALVPTSFAYQVEYVASNQNLANVFGYQPLPFTVSDNEGINGLNFVTANDPRVVVQPVPDNPDFYPLKYPNPESPVTLADGVEARLIEAEAGLQAGDVTGWLAKLNVLRATAITPAMSPLKDPGTPAARIDLTFRERAFWMFLTGHRTGDLRRLVRQYGRDQATVFPTGPYNSKTSYGADVNAPVPYAEQAANPKFKGCIDRDA